MNRHTKATPQQVTPMTNVQCYGCGWKGMLAEAKQSVYLDIRKEFFIPAEMGGNGKNWRCPQCKQLIFYTRSDHNRKNIAASGHQYRDAI